MDRETQELRTAGIATDERATALRSGTRRQATKAGRRRSKATGRKVGLAILAALAGLAGTAKVEAAPILYGAEIYSKDMVKYGRFEMRMRVAATPGSISSFFTYHPDSWKGLPSPWRELDIEILGKNPKGLQSNIISGDLANKITSEEFHTSTIDLSAGFHTYTLDWTPDSIVWRLDGVLLRKDEGTAQVLELTDLPETYRMNLWASNSVAWAGRIDSTKLPILQVVNWMAYSSWTPGAGPGGSDFTPQWTDEFDQLNTRRWSLADWTFDTNVAQFTAENAVTKDGYLVLCLTRMGAPGLTVPVPQDPLGNKRTPATSIAPAPRVGAALHGQAGTLRVPAGDQAVEIVVSAPDGRILASRTGTGEVAFHGLPGGIVHVRIGDRTMRALML